jgi:hypothetical protein
MEWAMNYREDLGRSVAEVVSSLDGTRAGKMFGYPAFFAGRRLFACVYGDGIALRLKPDDVIGTEARVNDFRPQGRVMRGWVLLVYPHEHAIGRDRPLFLRAIERLSC